MVSKRFADRSTQSSIDPGPFAEGFQDVRLPILAFTDAVGLLSRSFHR